MTVEEPTLAAVRHAIRAEGEGVDDDQITREITAATALVNKHAPNAPQAVGTEAIIRVVGALYDLDFSETAAGIFRRSGAKGLLAPWTVRRGGAI